jgi:hypothetical protein
VPSDPACCSESAPKCTNFPAGAAATPYLFRPGRERIEIDDGGFGSFGNLWAKIWLFPRFMAGVATFKRLFVGIGEFRPILRFNRFLNLAQ